MTEAHEKGSGCLTAIYVLFGVGMFALVLAGLALYVALKSPEGRSFVSAVKEGLSWLEKAQQAPGAAELREMGCDTALVTNLADATEPFRNLMPEGSRKELEEEHTARMLEQLMVICIVGRMTLTSPDCSEVARVYASSVESPPESFFVLVQRQGRSDTVCQGLYDEDGRFLESTTNL